MLHYIFRLKNEDGLKIATSYDTNEYLSFQIGAKEVITGEQEWVHSSDRPNVRFGRTVRPNLYRAVRPK